MHEGADKLILFTFHSFMKVYLYCLSKMTFPLWNFSMMSYTSLQYTSAMIYFEEILIKLYTSVLKPMITLKMLTQIFLYYSLSWFIFCEY